MNHMINYFIHESNSCQLIIKLNSFFYKYFLNSYIPYKSKHQSSGESRIDNRKLSIQRIRRKEDKKETKTSGRKDKNERKTKQTTSKLLELDTVLQRGRRKDASTRSLDSWTLDFWKRQRNGDFAGDTEH